MRPTLAALVAILACSAPAWSSPEPTETVAQRRCERGIALYRRGELAAAIVEFEAAYALAPTPALLFDIAQARRRLGDPARALVAYRAYLEQAGPAPDRTVAEAHARALAAQLRRPAPLFAAERPLEIDPVGASASTSRDRPPLRRRAFIGVLAATGASGLLTLGVAGALTARANGDAEALATSPPGTPWSGIYRDRYDDGRASQNAAIGLYVVGGAVLAGTALAAIVGRRWLKEPHRLAQRVEWTF